MTTNLDRSHSRTITPRYLLAADAFLITGAAFMAVTLIPVPGGGPEWAQALTSILLMLLVLGAGIALTWRLHGLRFHRSAWLGLLAGLAAGALLVALVVGVLALYVAMRPAPPIQEGNEGLWALIAVPVVLGAAFLAWPVVEAIRDLTAQREHVRTSWIRIGALVLLVALVLVSVWVGGEMAEAGLFMVPFAAGAACGIVGMAMATSRLERRVERR